jgi:hypothetical protein
MGIDVYIYWNGQTKKEKEAQYTGFDIRAGQVGYLRASYGMGVECEILRKIFPANCWKCKAIKFDFVENYKRIPDLLSAYLNDEKIIISDETEKRREVFKEIGKFLVTLPADKIIIPNNNDELKFKMTWAQSIVEFFKLGIKLQIENKEPKVYISY